MFKWWKETSKSNKVRWVLGIIICFIIAFCFWLWPRDITSAPNGKEQKSDRDLTNNKSIEICSSDFINNWSGREDFIIEDNQLILELTKSAQLLICNAEISENFTFSFDAYSKNEGEVNIIVRVGNMYRFIIGNSDLKNLTLYINSAYPATPPKWVLFNQVYLPNEIRPGWKIGLTLSSVAHNNSKMRALVLQLTYFPNEIEIANQIPFDKTFEINLPSENNSKKIKIMVGLGKNITGGENKAIFENFHLRENN